MANHKFESMMKMAKANNAERENEKNEQQKPELAAQPEVVNAADEITSNPGAVIITEELKPAKRGRKKQGGGEAATQRSSAERGCKSGYSRHGYVLPLTMIEQVSNLAKHFGYTESYVTEMLIQKGIDEVIAKHGKACISDKKVKELF